MLFHRSSFLTSCFSHHTSLISTHCLLFLSHGAQIVPFGVFTSCLHLLLRSLVVFRDVFLPLCCSSVFVEVTSEADAQLSLSDIVGFVSLLCTRKRKQGVTIATAVRYDTFVLRKDAPQPGLWAGRAPALLMFGCI